MRFPPQLLDEIRARLPVSQVVSRRVALKRQGREFMGLSPFKVEKTPSFTVNDHKGFYHCFATGEHGDIFTFLMKTEGLQFPEAVERLAEEAGVPMPKPSPELVKQANELDRLVAASEAAAKFYEERLKAADGRAARDYLVRRGLAAETIANFRLGYAPDSRSALKEHLASKGFKTEEMAKAGLLISGPDISVPYDRFRGRLMIPIPDLKGRVIAFGGRALKPDQTPKYLNSPETPLFHKGRILYNAARARMPAHDAGTVVVVEGYMDVIALAEAGVGHAVAPLGTALTPDQIKLLWRLAPEPILCFDGDTAGQKAAHRAVDNVMPLLEPGKSLRFAFLPSGLDPDDLVRQQGPEAVRRVLANADGLLDVIWRRELAREPADTPERRAALTKRVEGLAAAVQDQPVREEYERALRQRLREFQWQSVRSGGSRGQAPGSGRSGPDWRARERAIGQKKPLAVNAALASRAALASSPLVIGTSPDVTRQALMLKTLVNNPWLLDEVAEEVAGLSLAAPALVRLRDGLLRIHAEAAPLDTASLSHHLTALSLDDAVGFVQRALTHNSDRFAEPGASPDKVLLAWRELLSLQHKFEDLRQDIAAAEAALSRDGTDQALSLLAELRQRQNTTETTAADGVIPVRRPA
ncbi:MAG: DNA primase [Hyphomicrobiaceae bacterium]